MMDFLTSLLSKNDETDESTDTTDLQTAFAALLVEAARADENYETQEQKIITAVLMKQFEVDKSGATAIRIKGEEAQASAIDLHQFTRTVKTLGEDEKVRFIEGLWRIVLSDDVRDPWEDALIRRVASLIHVTDVQSAKARQRVEAEGS